jgi:hypothetical protein
MMLGLSRGLGCRFGAAYFVSRCDIPWRPPLATCVSFADLVLFYVTNLLRRLRETIEDIDHPVLVLLMLCQPYCARRER